jgi:predicted transcriptional regulator
MALTVYEKVILKEMHNSYRPMSIREISKESNISWITAKKYILTLLSKDFIKLIKIKERDYYKFNYDLLNDPP